MANFTDDNNNSYTTSTNITFGSDELKETWWFAQTFSLPGLSMSPPQVNNRSGAMVNLAPDVVDYGELSMDVLLDKEWKVYDSLYAYFIKRLNVETGTFEKYKQFDLWVEFHNGEGTKTKKFWFYKCRMTNFGDLTLDTQDPEDTLNTFTMSFVFDYFDFENYFFKERIKQGH